MASNNATNTPQLTTNGQLLIGHTSNNPSAATLTAGSGITVTNGAGSITLSATGSGNFVDQTTGAVTVAPSTTYLTDNGASLVTYTLPGSPAVGDFYEILGFSAGGWTVAQNASNVIHFGSVTTTTGVGGSLSSSNQYDKITIRCAAANTWIAYNAQGNITYV